MWQKDLDLLTLQYYMASYNYYIKDTPIMADEQYDALCKLLLANYGKVSPTLKKIMNLSDDLLICGSGFDLRFPE